MFRMCVTFYDAQISTSAEHSASYYSALQTDVHTQFTHPLEHNVQYITAHTAFK